MSGPEYTRRMAPSFLPPSFLFSFSFSSSWLHFSEAVSFSKPFPCLLIFYLERVPGREVVGKASHLILQTVAPWSRFGKV